MLTFGQWIDNRDTPSASDETIDVENPSDHSVLGRVPAGCAEDADRALRSARAAQKAWAKVPSSGRAKVLRQIGAIVRDHRDELIEGLVAEQSKVPALAAAEVDTVASYFDYHAGMCYEFGGEIIPSDNAGETMYLHYLPLGVSVGICPWNFPVFVFARKVAPALLAGCSVVVKSSELTPLTVFRLMKRVTEAVDAGKCDLPPGVVSVLTGYGHTVGEALTKGPIPDIISMTGSVATGQKIMANAAANMTKVSLELGGKAPCIVMDDADLDAAVDAIVASRVIFSGQVCNCAERVYVHESVYDDFLERFVKKMRSTKFGGPGREGMEYGSLISGEHRRKVQDMVDRARAAGAEVLCGGGPSGGPGYFYPPTVIVGAAQDAEINQKEIFGPVVPVNKFATFDEAIDLANDCEYGLTSSIFTESYRLIERARTELLFGETYVNRSHFESMAGFHAGWRKSGVGGADGRHGVLEYFGTKVVYLQS